MPRFHQDFPKIIGYYRIDSFSHINLDHRPGWIRRILVKAILGWKWVDY